MNQTKVNKQAKMDVRAMNFYHAGEALGSEAANYDEMFRTEAKKIKTPADRKALRAGFVAVYSAMRSVSEDTAIAKFNYDMRKLNPASSRKAKSNARKAEASEANAADDSDGDVGGDGAKIVHLSDKIMARNILNATRMLAAWQSTTTDDDVLGHIGEIIAALSATK